MAKISKDNDNLPRYHVQRVCNLSDSHLLSAGVGDLQQASEVGMYVVRKVVQLYTSQQINR